MSQEKKRSGLFGLFDQLRESLPGRKPAPRQRLRVTSHVARDLLQNAAYFNSVPKVVAEYVTNAVDNAKSGKPVRCEVRISAEQISITDNGAGMTYAELSNFFQMHGENIQRKRGRTVRGKFGTGKSAAFGVANHLRIETVKDNLRNIVELQRVDVEAAQNGEPIPVRELVVNQKTGDPAGTVVHVRDQIVGEASPEETRLYLEKLFGQHLRSHKIIVNGTACRYRMPRVDSTYTFQPPDSVLTLIGQADCTLRVSAEPLGREDNVIAILCHGYLHATTLAGRSREPLVEYVFGEVEVPGLDDDHGPVPAFDNTRNLTLNPQNPKVRALEAWLGDCLDEVLKKLAARERRRRLAREQRLLHKVAVDIKTFLDDDFLVLQDAYPWASLPGARKRAAPVQDSGDRPAKSAGKPPSSSVFRRGFAWVRRLLGLGPTRKAARPRRAAPVAFEIRYVRNGSQEPRARYDPQEGVITLNRDHPQLRTSEREAGLESNTFKMLSYDIAFTEYALAVAAYVSRRGSGYDREVDPSALVQQILDRLGRKAAAHLDSGYQEEDQE
ncbi:MAG: ATP-binding protein [Chloroflexota bacterium]